MPFTEMRWPGRGAVFSFWLVVSRSQGQVLHLVSRAVHCLQLGCGLKLGPEVHWKGAAL